MEDELSEDPADEQTAHREIRTRNRKQRALLLLTGFVWRVCGQVNTHRVFACGGLVVLSLPWMKVAFNAVNLLDGLRQMLKRSELVVVAEESAADKGRCSLKLRQVVVSAYEIPANSFGGAFQ